MGAAKDPNNVKHAALPVGGFAAFAPYGTKIPTPQEGKNLEYAFEGYTKLGLIAPDGGFEYTLEADGDALTFWQEGYSIPSGIANASVTFTLSQTDKTTQEFIRGKKFDEHGFMVVDAGGNPNSYVFVTEEIFKNKTIRRRICANASIASVKETKSESGKVTSYEVTMKLREHASHAGGQFGEWLLNLPAELVG